MTFYDRVMGPNAVYDEPATYLQFSGNFLDSSPSDLLNISGTGTAFVSGGIDASQAVRIEGDAAYVHFGSNARLVLGNSVFLNDGANIVFWVRAQTSHVWADGVKRVLFYLETDTGDYIEIYKSTTNNQVKIDFLGNGVLDTITRNSIFSTGWHFVSVIWKDTSLSFYWNGILVGTATIEPLTGSTVDEMFLGNNAGGANGWDNDIDEFVFWGSQLGEIPASTVWLLYASGVGASLPGPTPVGTNSIVQVFDRTGVAIGEIIPKVDYLTWRRNKIGQAQLVMARTDPKANETFLAAQNRILIQFDNGLPPWGGVIQPEYGIDGRQITITAKTAEVLLGGRKTDRGRYFSDVSVGGIGQALINEANAVWPLGMAIGTVWGGGDGHSPEYHYKSLLDIFQQSLFSRLSLADFYAEPVVDSDGRLSFSIHILERRGGERYGVALHQGLNVSEGSQVSYQGPIINHWTVVGDGQGWGDDRPTAVAQDTDSIQRYGLLEGTEIHQGVVNIATLQTIANNLLVKTKQPRVSLDVTAVNKPPGRFGQYWLGDTLPVELPSFGIGGAFIGRAKVEAAAFYPESGDLNLVVEAV